MVAFLILILVCKEIYSWFFEIWKKLQNLDKSEQVTLEFLDDFNVQNYHSKRNLDLTCSPFAEFGTDHRGGTRKKATGMVAFLIQSLGFTHLDSVDKLKEIEI